MVARRLRRPRPPVTLPQERADHIVPWQSLLEREGDAWQQAVARAKGGPKVLLATGNGDHPGVTPIESLLGIALTLRGAEVHYLLCDALLPACMLATHGGGRRHADFVAGGPQAYLCDRCIRQGNEIFGPLHLPIHRYSDFVSPQRRAELGRLAATLPFADIKAYCLDGLAIGEHAMAGALRYFARGTLDEEPDAELVLRRYFEAALFTAEVSQRLMTQESFDVATFHHGIYVPQGIVGEVARQHGLRVVNWNPAYRKHCFIFSHGDTYHHTLMDEPTTAWERLPWTAEMEAEVMDYLKSRWLGSKDWIWFHENPQNDLAQISAELGINFSKPTIGLLTNVMWDAQLHYPANAFPNMLSWVLESITYFAGRPDLQLVIRVHPAEIRGTVPSRQKIVDEIAAAFPKLSPNVIVIPPESNVSTYAVTLQCDSVIIYGTKTGVELSSFSVPVIVAGEAWIRNKGVTLDARSREEYFQILDRLPLGERMDEATTRRARMYAYHFFFRHMIPLPMMQPLAGWPPYRADVQRLVEMAPGADPGLDVICDGILQSAPFIYPAEQFSHQRHPSPAPVTAQLARYP